MCKLYDSKQLDSYLVFKGLISRQQHAFLKKQSTVTYYNVRTTGHSLSMVGILSMLSILTLHVHAFDSVVHSELIFKLSTFGISGNLLNWIAAF